MRRRSKSLSYRLQCREMQPSASVLLPGTPDEAILTPLQDSGLDVLIMGAYGHSRISSLVVGSTTMAILQKAPVPVLLVR